MDYYEIGQRIRRFRKACNMSQDELSEKVGISVTHMSHIENGNTKLSLPVFVAIASALSVHTDELLYDISPDNKTAAKNDILNIVDSCTVQEEYIIKDIIKATKEAFDKYKR